MPIFLRKAILATAVAGALAGLAAGPASASEPSMQVRVCNATPGKDVWWAWIVGTNQDGRRDVTSPGFRVGGYRGCTTLENWWWKIGTFMDVKYNTDQQQNQSWSQKVEGQNGGTYQVNLGYVE